MDPLAFANVNYFNAVVAERAHEQSLAYRIETEMIDPAFDSRQRNCSGWF
jgi:hypothetical protein